MRIVFCLFLFIAIVSPLQAEESLFFSDDQGKRDPFWRLVTPSGVIINYDKDILASDMVLEGILVGENGNNVAIIDGKIIKEKDTLGVFIVEEIGPDSVVLRKGQENFTLTLKKEE